MKKVTLLIIFIMIFFSKNNVSADYDKVFFDFKINSISGEQIDLGNYKNKIILVELIIIALVMYKYYNATLTKNFLLFYTFLFSSCMLLWFKVSGKKF